MNPADLLFLAFALSVDAFVVAFSFGLIIKKNRFRNGMEISLATGGGQFLMPVLGFFLTGNRTRLHSGMGPLAGICRLHHTGDQRHPGGLEPQDEQGTARRLFPDGLHPAGRRHSHQHRRPCSGHQHLPFLRPMRGLPAVPRGIPTRGSHWSHHLPLHGCRLFPGPQTAPVPLFSSGSWCGNHPHRPGSENALRPYVLTPGMAEVFHSITDKNAPIQP